MREETAMTTDNSALILSLTMQLLQQDTLTKTLLSGGGADLRSLLLKNAGARRLTDPTAAALTGRIRSDAGMLRQASRNVSEAASVSLMAASGVTSMRESLDRMKAIAEGVADGSISTTAGRAEYNDLVKVIDGAIASASYNGMKLFDSDGWAADERITLTGTAGAPGTTGKVHIQAGTGGFDMSLHDMSFIADRNFSSLSGVNGLTMVGATDLADASAASTAATRLSSLTSYVSGIESMLSSRATGFASQASSLASQASILDAAAATRARTNESRTLEQLILDYLVTDAGKLVDSSS